MSNQSPFGGAPMGQGGGAPAFSSFAAPSDASSNQNQPSMDPTGAGNGQQFNLPSALSGIPMLPQQNGVPLMMGTTPLQQQLSALTAGLSAAAPQAQQQQPNQQSNNVNVSLQPSNQGQGGTVDFSSLPALFGQNPQLLLSSQPQAVQQLLLPLQQQQQQQAQPLPQQTQTLPFSIPFQQQQQPQQTPQPLQLPNLNAQQLQLAQQILGSATANGTFNLASLGGLMAMLNPAANNNNNNNQMPQMPMAPPQLNSLGGLFPGTTAGAPTGGLTVDASGNLVPSPAVPQANMFGELSAAKTPVNNTTNQQASKQPSDVEWAEPFAGKGKKEPPFPLKLHQILSNPEFQECICWNPHGRSWRILKPQVFEQVCIPLYFRHAKYASFMRQVNGWGFKRILSGSDHNSYYHEMFVRDCPQLCLKMRRIRKGEKVESKDETGPDEEASYEGEISDAPQSKSNHEAVAVPPSAPEQSGTPKPLAPLLPASGMPSAGPPVASRDSGAMSDGALHGLPLQTAGNAEAASSVADSASQSSQALSLQGLGNLQGLSAQAPALQALAGQLPANLQSLLAQEPGMLQGLSNSSQGLPAANLSQSLAGAGPTIQGLFGNFAPAAPVGGQAPAPADTPGAPPAPTPPPAPAGLLPPIPGMQGQAPAAVDAAALAKLQEALAAAQNASAPSSSDKEAQGPASDGGLNVPANLGFLASQLTGPNGFAFAAQLQAAMPSAPATGESKTEDTKSEQDTS